MSRFHYHENDPEGLHTLEAVSRAGRFNQWMFEQVQPWMKGEILEVGSGIGNISRFFVAQGARITLSDIRSAYCDQLRRSFPGNQVQLLDLVHPDFSTEYASLLGRFDSAFALNVVEHIEDDVLAMQNLVQLLRPGGTVVILVPAGPWLYNSIDTGLEHFRRYTPQRLQALFAASKLSVDRCWMFNALGIPAWMYGGWFARKREIEGGQMNAYDKLVPLARLLDRISFSRIGLSVIAAGRK